MGDRVEDGLIALLALIASLEKAHGSRQAAKKREISFGLFVLTSAT
jgi:hypothetical protein